MKKIIRKIFLNKEIKSKYGELHFQRWTIMSLPWFSIYLHFIYKADEDAHLHNHPWNYLSFVVYGTFIEQTENNHLECILPGKIIIRKAKVYHKITDLFTNKIITLFITGKRFNEWGYEVNGKFVGHKEYRILKNENKL